MEVNDFKVGDVVKVARDAEHYYFDSSCLGRTGVVVHLRQKSNEVGVEFGTTFSEGHTCEGNARKYRGQYFRPSQLDVVTEDKPSVNIDGKNYIMSGKLDNGDIVFSPEVEVEYNVRFDEKFKADKVIWNRAKGLTIIEYTSDFDKSRKKRKMTAKCKPEDTFDKQKGFEVACLKAIIAICKDRLSRY